MLAFIIAVQLFGANARACYLAAEAFWNKTQDTANDSISVTQQGYDRFADCAKIAASKINFDEESYYADTIGAMYAQAWLGVLYKRMPDDTKAHEHFSLARELNAEARTIVSSHDPTGIEATLLQKRDDEYRDLDSGALAPR